MRLGRGKPDASKPVALPGHGDLLTLAMTSGERLPARVLERGVNTLLLAITVATGPLSAGELEGLVVEFTAHHGRVRLQGAVKLENPAEPDVLRMDSPRSIEVLQEREYVRINAARPVLVYAGSDLLEIQSYTVDLSGGGFLLAGPHTLEIGEEVSFQLSLNHDVLPIAGKARVVRVDRQGRRAAVFHEISDLDRRRLVRFIFECQRTERHRGLREENDGN
ncbi:MAG TPA: PilZ domain-containing protein [Solirubrobacteraceae bacterium]|nr:PilZ domain-containing protein [Solirubrobacteraceae bacterium]